MQRRDRDIAVGNDLDVGLMAGSFDDGREPEPIIAIAARVGPFDDSKTAVLANAVAANADPFDGFGRKCRAGREGR